ncbi:MAG: YbaK/EbsC family protein [Eubacteriales bacterium]|nr:YbaK/EbsC family protein [Bacillota bacterium]
MSETLSSSAQKVQDVLKALGFSHRVMELTQTTRTSVEAAEAVGCEVGQIAKSLVFKSKNLNRPVLIIASGSNRVNEKRIKEYLAEAIGKADADFVRQQTGYAIGGVAPVGHPAQMEIFIDEDLFQNQEIWAAAGNPNALFKLTPADLVKMTGGRVVSIK